MPRSLKLGLTAEQIARRAHCIGGSDAGTLMSGNPLAVNDLWLVKTGQRAPDDLSRVLPVQMGSWTEEFNRYWFELTTGRTVSHEGDERQHPEHPWMTCTLDGYTTTASGEGAVFEAKHVGGFQKIEDVVERYMAQVHHCMAVCGLDHAVLSVFIGNAGHEVYEVASDFLYAAQLLDREREFWACVQEQRAPHAMPEVAAPVPPGKLRAVSMEGRNEWAAHAADWLANKAAAGAFDKAAKGIKELMERDVGEAVGHGIICKRDKASKLAIKEHGNGTR